MLKLVSKSDPTTHKHRLRAYNTGTMALSVCGCPAWLTTEVSAVLTLRLHVATLLSLSFSIYRMGTGVLPSDMERKQDQEAVPVKYTASGI